MELIYAWIKKFRNYEKTELNFSDRFKTNFYQENMKIEISHNEEYFSIYPEHITNINAIVGKNSVGKTNLLDAIGLRPSDRNKNKEEYEIRYKKSQRRFGHLIPDDIEAEIKKSKYFFIYYYGKDKTGQDLFCIEGNDIDSFKDIIKKESGLDYNYWRSKYWFAFICNYEEGKLTHKYDLNKKIGYHWTEGTRVYGDYLEEQDKHVIISFRDGFNQKYYDQSSMKTSDDYKISVPRRNAEFQSNLLYSKIEILFKELNKRNPQMFRDEKYLLKITYNSHYLSETFLKGEEYKELELTYSYEKFDGVEKKTFKIIESFVMFYFRALSYDYKIEKVKKRIIELKQLKPEDTSIDAIKDYYIKLVELITIKHFNGKDDKEYGEYIIFSFKEFIKELTENKSIEINDDDISIKISKETDLKAVKRFIEKTVDEKVSREIDGKNTAFGSFFGHSLENLSDGENAYLRMFASINEQISILNKEKESYILCFDEPEARFHPEQNRIFIDILITFLSEIREGKQKFQIIISTHSPFLLSDIQANNILFLTKDKTGKCSPQKVSLKTFGTNIHMLLKDGFFMTSTMGEFATNKIKETILKIENCDSTDVQNITEEQKREWLYIINSIGEPLVQNRILKMYMEKFSPNHSDIYQENKKLKEKIKAYEDQANVNDLIEVIKDKINKLQAHVSELEANKHDKN